MKNFTTWLFRPFEKIAGWKALGWGVVGTAVSTVLGYYAGYHYHGLLHFGPASNDAWWVYAVERGTVWFVPALLFWIGGLILSRSRIRAVDVFGTVAFAQLPLIGMNLFAFTPPMQRLNGYDMSRSIEEIAKDTRLMSDAMFSLIGVIFLVWALIWMFNALKTSCNLKGARLGIWYALAVIGGDLLCRVVISSFY